MKKVDEGVILAPQNFPLKPRNPCRDSSYANQAKKFQTKPHLGQKFNIFLKNGKNSKNSRKFQEKRPRTPLNSPRSFPQSILTPS